MADEPKQLSKEERTKFKDWLESKSVNPQCPACRKSSWGIGDHIISSMTIGDGRSHIGGTLYPTAFIFCEHCLYVMHFLAVPIGLKIVKEPEDSSDG